MQYITLNIDEVSCHNICCWWWLCCRDVTVYYHVTRANICRLHFFNRFFFKSRNALDNTLSTPQTPSSGLQHPSLEEGAGKRRSECEHPSSPPPPTPPPPTHTQPPMHTPSAAFRHLPPNSARFSYATEGALFISAQLSSDAVSALRKVRVLTRLSKQPSAQVARKHETHPPRVKEGVFW